MIIDMKQYFVIHAARQSGKTTYLKELTRQLNDEGKYYAFYCTLERLQEVFDMKEGIPAIVKTLESQIIKTNLPFKDDFAKDADYDDYTNVFHDVLIQYCKLLDKPFVMFFDEADSLSEDTLIAFLRHLRSGYNNRGETPFVHSVALVGMRNIKDYRWKVRPDSESRHAASPFNIVTEVLTIKNFTPEQVWELYLQHTVETGQIFENDAVKYIYEQTQGQPWLVNATAREVIAKLLEWDYAKPVTKALAEQAIHNIIIRRDTHIDQLLEKLKEPRVRSVVEPLLLGGYIDTSTEDFSYVCDLGIIRKTPSKIEFSNPIYNEVITRTLNSTLQEQLTRNNPKYDMPAYYKNDAIDMTLLMSDFQQFWRENSGIWKERFEYKEAAPHLILMAFLQRVINGGGDIIREYAADTDRCDLNLRYRNKRYPIELKIRRSEKTLATGLEQLSQYMDTLGCNEGWLVIFDQRRNQSWSKKIFRKQHILPDGKTITVVGA
jgi:type II secretory pathway predicted ATPase ExeA